MFQPFFENLRGAGIPVSLREYLTFLQGMKAGLATYDIEAFYYLGRVAMVKDERLQDIMVYQMLSSTLSQFVEDESFIRRFSLKLFFISQSMRKAAFEGKIDYIPEYLSQIPRLFANHQIGLDAALVQVSPPDKFGYCSLGVSVDITRSAVHHAAMVIARDDQDATGW